MEAVSRISLVGVSILEEEEKSCCSCCCCCCCCFSSICTTVPLSEWTEGAPIMIDIMWGVFGLCGEKYCVYEMNKCRSMFDDGRDRTIKDKR